MDTKQAKKRLLKDKLKKLEKIRNQRLDRSIYKKPQIKSDVYIAESQSQHISLQNLYSSGEANSLSDCATDLLSEDIDALSELRSDDDQLCSENIIKQHTSENLSTTSSDKEKLSISTHEDDSDSKASDRNIAIYNLSNDHCYSVTEAEKKKFSSSEIYNQSSEEMKLEFNENDHNQQIDSDASDCAEVIISSSTRVCKTLWKSDDGSLKNSVDIVDKINADIDFPTTPESQTDENTDLIQTANAMLDKRFKDISVFVELINLKVKQLKSQKKNITCVDDVASLFHKLYRFNVKCENNFKNFNSYVITNYKKIINEFGVCFEESSKFLGDETKLCKTKADKSKKNCNNIGGNINFSDFPESDKILQDFNNYNNLVRKVSVSLVRFDDKQTFQADKDKHLIRNVRVTLERCDNKYPAISKTNVNEYKDLDCDTEKENSDIDKEINNLINFGSLKRKRSSSLTDNSNVSPKRLKCLSISNEDDLYSSESTESSEISNPKLANSCINESPVESLNELAKKQILDFSDSLSNTDLDIENNGPLTSVSSDSENVSEVLNNYYDAIKEVGLHEVNKQKDTKYELFKSLPDSKFPLPDLKFDCNIDSSGESNYSSSPLKKLFNKMNKRNKQRRDMTSQIWEINSSDSECDLFESKNKRKGRKNIRNILDDDNLDRDTQIANKEEKLRLERLLQRNMNLSQSSEDLKGNLDSFILDYDADTKEPLVMVHPNINKHLKTHQRDGIRFMWDSCYESVEMIKKGNDKGQGCILAHCMGLGKTLQVIALAHTVMQNTLCKTKTVLVVCPRSVTLNWREEILRWLSPFPRYERKVYDFKDVTDLKQRILLLKKWHEHGGIMLISYDMYRSLLKRVDQNDSNKTTLNDLSIALRKPGPDIVFLDEGHILKNEKTIVRKQLEEISTKRRIILTGTPMQNNLKEYYWMVHFVKPKLLGSFKEYSNRFANPILNGQHKDSVERDIQIMKKRSHVLHKLLEGTVQRREVSILCEYLPKKYEYVLLLTPSPMQEKLYNYFLTDFGQKLSDDIKLVAAKFFSDFQALKRIWTHPYALVDFLERNMESQKRLKTRQLSNNKPKTENEIKKYATMDIDEIIDDPNESSIRKIINRYKEPLVPWDWWSKICSSNDLNNISSSSKLTVMFDIIQECKLTNEKVLVFSSSLNVLNTIEHFLRIITEQTMSKYSGSHPIIGTHRGIWQHTLDYYRFDGQLPLDLRQQYCKNFNDTSNARGRLFLVSTRAGGIGLNMTGANRVIILDVSWNPAIDTQSIFRAYRLQQNKTCYIYRLIAMGFMEQKIYERSVTKQAVSCRVVDEQQIDRHYTMADLRELYVLYKTPEARPIPKIPEDPILATLLPGADHIYSYHEHDSLLMNLEEEELMPEEQEKAWEEFLQEKEASLNPAHFLNMNSYDRNVIDNFSLANDNLLYNYQINQTQPLAYLQRQQIDYLEAGIRNLENIPTINLVSPTKSLYRLAADKRISQNSDRQFIDLTSIPSTSTSDINSTGPKGYRNNTQDKSIVPPMSNNIELFRPAVRNSNDKTIQKCLDVPVSNEVEIPTPKQSTNYVAGDIVNSYLGRDCINAAQSSRSQIIINNNNPILTKSNKEKLGVETLKGGSTDMSATPFQDLLETNSDIGIGLQNNNSENIEDNLHDYCIKIRKPEAINKEFSNSLKSNSNNFTLSQEDEARIESSLASLTRDEERKKNEVAELQLFLDGL